MSTPETTTTATPRRASRAWLWVTLGILLIIGVVVAWSVINGRLPFTPPSFRGQVIQSPEPTADFTLTDHNGQPLKLSDLRGKVVLIYFGYTFCPDVCPSTLSELKKVPPALGDRAEDVQVVLITVDPQRDTPDVLRDYLSHFDPSFLGLTGTEEEILAAATPFGIYFSKHEGTPITGYLVDHTSSVLALDKEGYLRLIYSFETPGEDIAADMRHLVRE